MPLQYIPQSGEDQIVCSNSTVHCVSETMHGMQGRNWEWRQVVCMECSGNNNELDQVAAEVRYIPHTAICTAICTAMCTAICTAICTAMCTAICTICSMGLLHWQGMAVEVATQCGVCWDRRLLVAREHGKGKYENLPLPRGDVVGTEQPHTLH